MQRVRLLLHRDLHVHAPVHHPAAQVAEEEGVRPAALVLREVDEFMEEERHAALLAVGRGGTECDDIDEGHAEDPLKTARHARPSRCAKPAHDEGVRDAINFGHAHASEKIGGEVGRERRVLIGVERASDGAVLAAARTHPRERRKRDNRGGQRPHDVGGGARHVLQASSRWIVPVRSRGVASMGVSVGSSLPLVAPPS